MRERCNELCTKLKTGQCTLCDALDKRDGFLRMAKWSILIGVILVLTITRAWELIAAFGIFLLFWATISLLRSSGFWQTIFSHLSLEQRNTKLGEFLIWFFEGTGYDGIHGIIYLVLGSVCSILAVLQIAPIATMWDWSIIIQVLEAIVLAITAIIVWRYTRETILLRVEAQKQVEVAQRQVEEIQKQTENQLRPFVIVEPIFTDDTSHGNFIAKNVGNGTAINIRVWFVRVQYDLKRREGDNVPLNDLFYEEVSFPDNESIWFRRPPVYFLTPHQSSELIEITATTKTGELSSSGRILYAGDAQSIFMIRIHFENVNGQKYFVEATIRNRTLKILRSGRFQEPTASDLLRITEDEEPYLTDKGREEVQNWIQPSYTYLP